MSFLVKNNVFSCVFEIFVVPLRSEISLESEIGVVSLRLASVRVDDLSVEGDSPAFVELSGVIRVKVSDIFSDLGMLLS
ncbi:MAG: hypothetical protein E7074_07285 [Bacteroidales bacterium]|jgi:hypothetical protein|nr:hypothetical protein [Bacteroidales bacterium]